MSRSRHLIQFVFGNKFHPVPMIEIIALKDVYADLEKYITPGEGSVHNVLAWYSIGTYELKMSLFISCNHVVSTWLQEIL